MLPNQGCNSLDSAMFPDLDSARLKKSAEYFVEHYASAELSRPPNGLSTWRLQSLSSAHRIFAVNVSWRLIETYRSETLTRYRSCVITSQGELRGSNENESEG